MKLVVLKPKFYVTNKIVRQWQETVCVNNLLISHAGGNRKEKKCILTRSKSSQANKAVSVPVLMCFNTAILCLWALKILISIYSYDLFLFLTLHAREHLCIHVDCLTVSYGLRVSLVLRPRPVFYKKKAELEPGLVALFIPQSV